MRKRILIADDEEDILTIVSDRLSFLGFEVEAVRDGLSCLEAIDSHLPDLVLLDIRMPGLDGLTVLDRLQRDRPRLPVIMLSASADRQRVANAVERGASDYLMKPFEPAMLESKVRRVLEKGDGDVG